MDDGPIGSGIGIDVYTDALIQQAKVWEEVSASVGQISSTADGLGYSGNSGFFVHAVENYNLARLSIKFWCQSGQETMQEISKALLRAVVTYKAAELHNIQRIHGVR